MQSAPELLSGTCRQFLFSPKGDVEGLLLTMKGRTVQVSMTAEVGAAMSRSTAPDKRLRLIGVPDHSPKTGDATHPVYQFESLADSAGNPVDGPNTEPGEGALKGVVAALHFARHGQPNGVVLDSGAFIHTGPRGMEAAALRVGSKVRAVGEIGMTILGTPMMEARQVNGIDLP